MITTEQGGDLLAAELALVVALLGERVEQLGHVVVTLEGVAVDLLGLGIGL